jgi:hypothetical protein
VPRFYRTEVNAPAFRAKGAALAMSMHWDMNHMIARTTLLGIDNSFEEHVGLTGNHKFWIMYVAVCAALVPITSLAYPETATPIST